MRKKYISEFQMLVVQRKRADLGLRRTRGRRAVGQRGHVRHGHQHREKIDPETTKCGFKYKNNDSHQRLTHFGILK